MYAKPHCRLLITPYNLCNNCSGVLMWEVYSEGRFPYENRTNTEVVESLNSGLRLLKPRMAPDSVHILMEWCWKEVSATIYHVPTAVIWGYLDNRGG